MLLEASGGISCPKCNRSTNTKVLDSREAILNDDTVGQYRRRKCVCGYRWNTLEISTKTPLKINWGRSND